jgi:hypothetical protein
MQLEQQQKCPVDVCPWLTYTIHPAASCIGAVDVLNITGRVRAVSSIVGCSSCDSICLLAHTAATSTGACPSLHSILEQYLPILGSVC